MLCCRQRLVGRCVSSVFKPILFIFARSVDDYLQFDVLEERNFDATRFPVLCFGNLNSRSGSKEPPARAAKKIDIAQINSRSVKLKMRVGSNISRR